MCILCTAWTSESIERSAIIIFQSDVSFDAFSPRGIISPRWLLLLESESEARSRAEELKKVREIPH